MLLISLWMSGMWYKCSAGVGELDQNAINSWQKSDFKLKEMNNNNNL